MVKEMFYYRKPFVKEMLCYGDVLLRRCFVWRRFVKEFVCASTIHCIGIQISHGISRYPHNRLQSPERSHQPYSFIGGHHSDFLCDVLSV